MRSFDRFVDKMNRSGGSIRKEIIHNTRQLIKSTFNDDPTSDFSVYFWELGLIDKSDFVYRKKISIRLYDEKFSAANGNTISFQTEYTTQIVVGDIIYVKDTDKFYICTEVFNIANENWQGKFTSCNWILKWQNKNGEILQYPCYEMNSTQYNSGERSSRVVTVGSSQHIITLPCDENTVELSTPQRFFLDKSKRNPTSFVVTQNDTTSYNYGKKGLVKVTVAECPTNNETDNFELGICDYFEPELEKTIPSDSAINSSISYQKDTIISGGGNQVFYGHFYDKDKNELDIKCCWKIVCDFAEHINLIEEDNAVYISIDNDDYIDEYFSLCLTDEDGNYLSTIDIKIESLL